MGIAAAAGGIRTNGGQVQETQSQSKKNKVNEITSNGDTTVDVGDNGTKETLLSVYCTHESELLNAKLSIFSSLSPADQAAVPELAERLQALGSRVTANGKFLQTLMKHGAMFLQGDVSVDTDAIENEETVENSEDEKQDSKRVTALEIRSLLEDIGRDWSADGALRRKALYKPILDAVVRAHNEGTLDSAGFELERSKFRVLVPGACTGRLCWELAKLGFAVEGNEASSARLAACNYLLNHADSNSPDTIYPYAHRHSHIRSASHQLAKVLVPDVTASAIGDITPGEFGMRVGEFVDVYRDDSDRIRMFDCVASCLAFELDERSAEYARTVAQVLKPAGIWVFLGPSPLPHDDTHVTALLTNSEFLSLVKKAGFKILQESTVKVPLDEPDCMRTRTYNAMMFVALKVRDAK